MEAKKKHSVFFHMALICSMVSSLSLLAAIMVNSEGKNKEILLVFGILFWIGLILEQIFFWNANRIMKNAPAKDKRHVRGKPGICSLSTYTEGLIADMIFVASLVALIVCMIAGLGETVLQYVLICFVVLSFRLHCFLNGRNYKYKKSQGRKGERKNG